MAPKLKPEERLKLIERVILGKEPVAKVCRQAGISRTLFYRWLKRYKEAPGAPEILTPGRRPQPKKRKISAKTQKIKILSPEEKLELIRRVEAGEEVADVCREKGISRTIFYRWKKRYQQAPPEEKLESLKAHKRHIERYFRQTPERYVQAVLDLVTHHPEYSVRKIVEHLPQVAGIPIVGHHGVQNILRRHNLSLYEQRLAYSQAQVTPVTRVISALEQAFARFFVFPIETRTAIVRFFSILSLSAFLTVVVLGGLGYFATVFKGVAPIYRPGLVFASIALSVGSLFFLYSMKYYFTLAIVLSFSRQPGEPAILGLNGRLNNNQKNGNGWLARIFGLNGSLRGPTSKEVGPPKVTAVGLEPNLESVKLERYPFVSIHLPFYNEKKVADRILSACTSFDYPNYEIVVCDDSTDETTEIAKQFLRENYGKLRFIKDEQGNEIYKTLSINPNQPSLTLIHRTSRSGFKGGALGEALKHMDPRTEFIIVFDADFIPYPDTLELFLKYFKTYNDGSEDYSKSNIACVAGYQWHVLNKSENWITRGVRTEYAGSYVIERSGQEVLGAMKLIHGSVYAIRADILKKFGWGTSITEDFELTLRLYAQGYKVVYTPYIQAPAECVSTLKRLIRQRMRWSEGHSYCVKRRFTQIMTSPLMTLTEKLEFLYLSPYYLQAAFFLVGTFSWLMAETVFRARLPFWTSLWGWSLVLTNFFSLPLVNAVGLFLEESEEKDYLGILSFVALSYLLVPFQAYASIKGFLEKQEGPWFRTPKTGLITDIFTRGRFYRWIAGILPGRLAPSPIHAESALISAAPIGAEISANPYLALATANNQFNGFKIKPKRLRWVSKAALVVLLIFSITLYTLSHDVSVVQATPVQKTLYIGPTDSTLITASTAHQLTESAGTCDTTSTSAKPGKKVQWTQFQAHTSPNTSSATPCPSSATGRGWVYQTEFVPPDGKLDGNFTIYYRDSDTEIGNTGTIRACLYRVEVSGGLIASSYLWPTGGTLTGATDMWTGGITNPTESFTDPCGDGCTFTSTQKYLYVDFYINNDGVGNNATAEMYFHQGACGTNYPAIVMDSFVIPEKILLIAIVVPFIPMIVLWIKRRRRLAPIINADKR